ncbi:hypothetical protein KY334_07235, partial [Candidatus Woesearchaeota archaeon]|nr:hypothetical protein [Candidatus Woesearchaeota archaeon]
MPRKTSSKKQQEELMKNTIANSVLDEKDMNYVNAFAKEMLNMFNNPLMYHPILQSEILKDINMNPAYRDYETVETLLRDPKHNEKALRQLSQYLSNTIAPIKRLIDYYSKILTWDYVLIPQVEEKELRTSAYKKAENKVYDFLESFNIKKMFTEMMQGSILEDTKFYYLRESEYGNTFQELPSDYCIITAKNEISYEVAFNMTYFFRPGTRLDLYPPEFTDYYLDMMNYDQKKGGIRTSDVIVEMKEGKWCYWRQLDPKKCFTFKFNNIISGLTPPLLGLFLDAVNIEQFRNLQKTKTALDAYKLLIGTIPRNKENKSGSKADDFAYSAATVAKFAALLKGAMPQGVDFKVTPFEKVESFNFENSDTKHNVVSTALKSFLNNSGSSQVLSINDKPNASSSKSNQLIDESFVVHMYSQAEGIINLILKNISPKYRMS